MPRAAIPANFGRLTAFATYAAVFALLAHRWIAHISSATPAGWDNRDARFVPWVLAWIAHALTHDPTAVYDAPINYPAPLQLTGSEHFASSEVVFAPVFWATGNALLAANIVALISYPLAAFAMERLLASLGLWIAARWVGGLIFALGPLRVPASLQVLQYLNLYLPLAALALHRVRVIPEGWRAGALALIFSLAIFSSYYLAVMVCMLVGVWFLFELFSPDRDRAAFTVRVLPAIALPLLLLGIASWPYFVRVGVLPAPRHALSAADPRQWGLPLLMALQAGYGVTELTPLNVWLASLGGLVPNLLALAGGIALVRAARPVRALGVVGLVIAVLGACLFVTGLRWLPDAIGGHLRFFRLSARFVVLFGFGQAVLAAIAIQAARDHLGQRIASFAFVATVALVMLTRGVHLVPEKLDDVAAVSDDAGTYRAIGSVARRVGSGPLLDLPLNSSRPNVPVAAESMLGSTWHWLPLLDGYTGFEAPARWQILRMVAQLPDSSVLDDLVDMTHLRWILLRGEKDWPGHQARQAFADGLEQYRGLGAEMRLGDFSLRRIEREPEHAGWFEALGRLPRSGYTLLGTPLAPLPDDAVRSLIEVVSFADQVPAASRVRPRFRVSNRGSVAWPAFVDTPWAAYTVCVEVRWQRLDGQDPAAVPATRYTPLRRDVPAGESLTQAIGITTPADPGLYQLVLRLRQLQGCEFRGPGNEPWLAPVRVVAAGPG